MADNTPANGMSPTDLAEADARLNEFAYAKDWQNGAAFLARLGPRKAQLERSWLVRHVELCAAAQPDFVQHYQEPKQRLARLAQVSTQPLGEWQDTQPLTGGKINQALFVHRLYQPESGHTLQLLEKVYPAHYQDKAAAEALLFHYIDAAQLNAPSLYGQITVGDFVSLFYAFVAGEHPSGYKVRTYQYQLLANLWQQGVPAGLPDELPVALHTDPLVGQLQRKSFRKRLARHLPAQLGLAQTGQPLATDQYLCRWGEWLAAQPTFIWHKDMTRANMLLAKSAATPVLLDWDKWQIRALGTGVRPPEDHSWSAFSAEFELLYTHFTESNQQRQGQPLSEQAWQVLVVLDNLCTAEKHRATERVEKLAGYLVALDQQAPVRLPDPSPAAGGQGSNTTQVPASLELESATTALATVARYQLPDLTGRRVLLVGPAHKMDPLAELAAREQAAQVHCVRPGDPLPEQAQPEQTNQVHPHEPSATPSQAQKHGWDLLVLALHPAEPLPGPDQKNGLASVLDTALAQLAPAGQAVLDIPVYSDKREARVHGWWAKADLRRWLRPQVWKTRGYGSLHEPARQCHYVISIKPRKPVAYLFLGVPGSGKSTVLRQLFRGQRRKVKVISGDRTYHRLAQGKLPQAEPLVPQLKALVNAQFDSQHIGAMTDRLCQNGLVNELVTLWLSLADGRDLAIDSYVPEEYHTQVVQAVLDAGYWPVQLSGPKPAKDPAARQFKDRLQQVCEPKVAPHAPPGGQTTRPARHTDHSGAGQPRSRVTQGWQRLRRKLRS